ncbi:MAG: hypothetical protein K0R59_2951 [Sphingobacterium sp.]|jgi:hypothetical protein|nr:hypothetical protein [Sphingobacterium sp.]
MKRFLLVIAIFLSIVSCKDDRNEPTSEENEMIAAFDKAKQSSIKRNISYLPLWQDRIEFEGNFYIPLKTDKRISSFTADSIKYSLDGKIWLKARNQGDDWKFAIITVLPDNPKLSKNSGIFLYEDWETGKFNYQGYIENKLFNPSTYIHTIVKTARVKKAGEPEACQTIYTEVCAGSGEYETCTVKTTTVCDNTAPPDDGIDPDNWITGGGDGSQAPPIVNNNTAPSEAELKEQIKDKPFALIPDIPCDIIKKWIETAKFAVDQSTWDRLTQIENTIKPGGDNSYLTNIQNINSAYSTVVNMDYFPITVNLLPLVNGKVATPEQFLEHIRKNINNFVDTDYSEFKPYVYSGVDDTNLWNSSNPKNAVVAIDIGAPDNGSVIVSKYNSSGWTFTTIYEPMYGQHPVSGNRDFGFTKNSNGSYTFFTKGVDRLTSLDLTIVQNATGIPFSKADALWTSFQKGVADFVNMNGGNAGASKQEIYRPNWEDVKAVVDGKAPLSSLSTDCEY